MVGGGATTGDTFYGENGDDTFVGNVGIPDVFWGGGGYDTFVNWEPTLDMTDGFVENFIPAP